MNTPDNINFDFSFELFAWCQWNGVADQEQIRALTEIIEKYYDRKEVSSSVIAAGVKYKELRLQRHLRSYEVAKAIGISPSYYGQIENGIVKNPGRRITTMLDDFYARKT